MRMRGAMLGLAVGDALGAAVEFTPPGEFEPVRDFRDGGPFHLKPGEWTDDTSMALAMADSINTTGWCLNDQARRYVAWWQDGKYSVNGRCFDIGNQTRDALSTFEMVGDARNSASTDPGRSGNGSIMRLAPAAIYAARHFPHDIPRLARIAADSSLPTHGSPQCISACQYMALVMAGLFHGESKEDVLDPKWEPLTVLKENVDLHWRIEEIAMGSFREKEPPEIKGKGWVVQSLEAALWAFESGDDFEMSVLAAVNLGDDADTTGAVCGQLAGACWGIDGIPDKWLDGLARREFIDGVTQRLVG
tara:strand:- start:1307 stop:2221 length:915 start_codon:yes stop_codon:yes gene_type:complete